MQHWDKLQAVCGFYDGILINERAGVIPASTATVRLAIDGNATAIIVAGLPRDSPVTFLINGAQHSTGAADKNGNVTLQFEHPVNFDRVHCAQLILPDITTDISYEVVV